VTTESERSTQNQTTGGALMAQPLIDGRNCSAETQIGTSGALRSFQRSPLDPMRYPAAESGPRRSGELNSPPRVLIGVDRSNVPIAGGAGGMGQMMF